MSGHIDQKVASMHLRRMEILQRIYLVLSRLSQLSNITSLPLTYFLVDKFYRIFRPQLSVRIWKTHLRKNKVGQQRLRMWLHQLPHCFIFDTAGWWRMRVVISTSTTIISIHPCCTCSTYQSVKNAAIKAMHLLDIHTSFLTQRSTCLRYACKISGAKLATKVFANPIYFVLLPGRSVGLP